MKQAVVLIRKKGMVIKQIAKKYRLGLAWSAKQFSNRDQLQESTKVVLFFAQDWTIILLI